MYNKLSNTYIGFIYLIENKINKKCYIGQTSNTIEKRWKQHCYDAKRNTYNMPIHKAIRKYGKNNFIIDEIERIECASKEELITELNLLEKDYIEQYNTYCGDGYNATIGGDSAGILLCKPVDVYDINGTFIETLGSRIEVSKKYDISSNTISSICNGKFGNYGCKYVFRNNGEPFSLYDVKTSYYLQIYRFTLDGKQMDIFYDMTSASASVNLKSKHAIKFFIDNPNLQIKGYWWSSTPKFNYMGRTNAKKVDLYDNQLNYIKTFDTVTGCADYVGVDSSVISEICMGRLGICKGYIARYHGDDIFKYKVNLDGDFTVKGVDEYSTNGELLNTYDTISLAAIQYNGNTSIICGCCKGKHQTAYNRVWRYRGEPFDKFPIDFIHYGREKQVDQYSLDGKFIKTWDSATLAANSFGSKYGTFILNVAKGIKRQAYGFVWRYKGHPYNEYRVNQVKLKPINQYDVELNYVKTWDSAKDIKIFYNYTSDSKIYRSLRKDTPICDGMIFYYANDPNQPDKTKIIPTTIQKEVS